VAGDAAVREEVGRVGEDEVHGIFRDFFQDFEVVALINADVMFGVVEDGSGKRIEDGFGHGAKREERSLDSGRKKVAASARDDDASSRRQIVDQLGIYDQGVKQIKRGRGWR